MIGVGSNAGPAGPCGPVGPAAELGVTGLLLTPPEEGGVLPTAPAKVTLRVNPRPLPAVGVLALGSNGGTATGVMGEPRVNGKAVLAERKVGGAIFNADRFCV